MSFRKHAIDWLYELRTKVVNGTLSTQTVLYDTTGVYRFNPDSCSEVLTYNVDGTVNTDTYTDPLTGYQFRQTYGYTTGFLTSVSGWVKL